MYSFLKETHRDSKNLIKGEKYYLEKIIQFVRKIIRWQKIYGKVKSIHDELLDKIQSTDSDYKFYWEEAKRELYKGDELEAKKLLKCRKDLKNDIAVEEKVFQMLDSILKFIECNFQCQNMIQKCYEVENQTFEEEWSNDKKDKEKPKETDKKDNEKLLELNEQIQKQKNIINIFRQTINDMENNKVNTVDFGPTQKIVLNLLEERIEMYETLIKNLEKNTQNDSKNVNSNDDKTIQYTQNVIKRIKDTITKLTNVKNGKRPIESNVDTDEVLAEFLN